MEVKETVEVMDFMTGYIKDLAAEKADDGRLDPFEIARASLKNAPAAVRAAIGSDKIGAELADLDPAEIQALAEKGLSLANAVLGLVGKAK